MRFIGGPCDGESRDDGISLTVEGYRLVKMPDGPLTVRWAVHDSIVPDAAPREIRRVVAHLHNEPLRAQKQPLYGTPEAVRLVHRELMQVFMRAEFLGVDIEAGRRPLKPLTQGHTAGWINAYAKTL